jgi:hypothetical protein
MVPLARAVDLMEIRPVIRRAIALWHPEGDPTEHDGLNQAMAAGLLEQLRAFRIRIGPGGSPAGEDVADPLGPPAPGKHVLSALLHARASHRFSELRLAADSRNRTRLLSASGPTAGKCLVASLATHGLRFTDSEWAGMLQWGHLHQLWCNQMS